MIIVALVTLGAAAAPEGYTVTESSHGCETAVGPTRDGKIADVYVACRWSDVDAEDLVARLSEFDRWGEFLWFLEDVEIITEDDGRQLVRQTQRARGVAPREDLLWMTKENEGDTWRFSWSSATELPLPVPEGAIRPDRNEGYWAVTRLEGGDVLVEQQVSYDPAGKVPKWMVRFVQNRGAAKVVRELRALAVGEAA